MHVCVLHAPMHSISIGKTKASVKSQKTNTCIAISNFCTQHCFFQCNLLLCFGQKNCQKGREFSENLGKICHKFAKLRHETGYLGRVSPNSWLLATHLNHLSWKRVANLVEICLRMLTTLAPSGNWKSKKKNLIHILSLLYNDSQLCFKTSRPE